ncbi:rCG51474 [Rattus norvegicus]|uniref:RCG51474 n=1 Tax=Rattus norvegicus TaxID=10116 RepID=A6IYT5_RAT|nr:rCG51474 [Rattus norvegicus]
MDTTQEGPVGLISKLLCIGGSRGGRGRCQLPLTPPCIKSAIRLLPCTCA